MVTFRPLKNTTKANSGGSRCSQTYFILPMRRCQSFFTMNVGAEQNNKKIIINL